jgi:hypothetical protein
MYYKLEDWLTARLQGDTVNIPFGLESEYLLCALRIEVRNLLDSVEFYYTPEDIEEIVRRMINDFSNSVLNNDYIEDTIKAYIVEKGGEV